MIKVRNSTLRDCIQLECVGLSTAGDKKESSSFNGWKRKMQCAKCDRKWTQIFYRGAFEIKS